MTVSRMKNSRDQVVLLMKSCYFVQRHNGTSKRRCGSDAVHHDVIRKTRCQDVGCFMFLKYDASMVSTTTLNSRL